jgi:dihydrodipicolinate synthase/N-acetylneuraminate lyase
MRANKEFVMDWTLLLTAISAIGAAGAASAAAWQAFETRKQVVESRNQGEMARAQFLQARYDDARPVLIIVSSP